MKTLMTLVLIFIFSIGYSQIIPAFKKGDALKLRSGSYEFVQSIPENVTPQQKSGTALRVPIEKGTKISVLYQYENLVYFKYWKFSDSSQFIKYNKNDQVFSIDTSHFSQLTRSLYKKYKGVSYGAYTVPFRLRNGGGTFDFESSLSLQANLVFGFGSKYKQESWLDASLGIGLTGVNLDDKNSVVDNDRTASAFTISFGGVIKPAKYANLGVFIGWDFLGLNDKDVNWNNDGKMWIGLGVNISFNEVKTDKSPASGNN